MNTAGFGLNLYHSLGMFASVMKLVLIILVIVGAGYGIIWLIKYLKSFSIKVYLFALTNSGIVPGFDKGRVVKDKKGKSSLNLFHHKNLFLPIPPEKRFLSDIFYHRIVFLVKTGEDSWAFWFPFLNADGVLKSSFQTLDKNWFAEQVKGAYEKYPKFKGWFEKYAGVISVTIIVFVVIIFFVVLSHVLQGVGADFNSAARAIEHGLMVLNKTG